MSAQIESNEVLSGQSLLLLENYEARLIRAEKKTSDHKTSALIWTLLNNILLTAAIILAFKSGDSSFFYRAGCIIPALAVVINLLDYKSMLFISEIKKNSRKLSATRLTPIAFTLCWAMTIFL